MHDKFSYISAALTFLGTDTDFATHEANGRAILALRHQLPPFIGEHIGNWGYSAAIIIPFALMSEYMRNSDSERMQSSANYVLFAGFLVCVLANLYAETFQGSKLILFDNSQFGMDFFFGITAGLCSASAAIGAVDRLMKQQSQVTSPSVQQSLGD
jgi:hypothetical protein